MTRFILLLLCLCGMGHAWAETRYITDQFQITMRKGESTGHKITRMLPSGVPVEVLGSNSASGYSRVRTEDGTAGYVLTRQLLEEPIARDRLAAVEARLGELQQAPDALAAKLTQLKSAHAVLKTDHGGLEEEKKRLEQELATIKHASANIMRVTQERSELRKNLADLTRQAADLQQENRELKNQTTQRWFLIGAGVVVGGILIGIILPHVRLHRRKNSWGSL